MKKITSLLLIAITMSMGACKRNGCWKCTTKALNSEGVRFSGAAAKSTECGLNEVEIRKLEEERSGTHTFTNSNGETTTSKVVTTCK
jgi:hypothetical protein